MKDKEPNEFLLIFSQESLSMEMPSLVNFNLSETGTQEQKTQSEPKEFTPERKQG